MADDVYDDDDDEETTAYPANDVEPGHARLHLNPINRVKCQVAAAGIAGEDTQRNDGDDTNFYCGVASIVKVHHFWV